MIQIVRASKLISKQKRTFFKFHDPGLHFVVEEVA